ncbi:hypothetical protein B7463_g4052, partial [Scytalidium lignicola]
MMASLVAPRHSLIVQPRDFTGNFIDNEIVTSNAERWMMVHNPATNAIITRVPRSTSSEIVQAVASSSKAFETWCIVNKTQRQDRLFDLAALMRIHETEIYQALTLTMETGKTIPDARSEV